MENALDEEKQLDKAADAVSEVEKVAELVRTEVSKVESKTNHIMTVGDGSAQPGHNLVEMTVGFTSPASAGQHKPSPRVKVKIEYPKGWKGIKHLPDGAVREVAPETAEQFVQLGIASIVNQDKPE